MRSWIDLFLSLTALAALAAGTAGAVSLTTRAFILPPATQVRIVVKP